MAGGFFSTCTSGAEHLLKPDAGVVNTHDKQNKQQNSDHQITPRFFSEMNLETSA